MFTLGSKKRSSMGRKWDYCICRSLFAPLFPISASIATWKSTRLVSERSKVRILLLLLSIQPRFFPWCNISRYARKKVIIIYAIFRIISSCIKPFDMVVKALHFHYVFYKHLAMKYRAIHVPSIPRTKPRSAKRDKKCRPIHVSRMSRFHGCESWKTRHFYEQNVSCGVFW